MTRSLLLAGLLLFALPTCLCAGEEFYVLIFGAQQVPNRPNYAHSFATFVRVSWEGDCPRPVNAAIEHHTISWLPSNLVVRCCSALPERGTNFDLPTTFRFCHEQQERVSMWGPYRCDRELYCKALEQKRHLESGVVRYKAVDTGRNSKWITNCIHTLANVLDGPRVRVFPPGWGEVASFAILRKYEARLLDSQSIHTWVSSAIGLDQYPIIYREWERPRSGLLGSVYRLTGGERDLEATYGPPHQK